MRPMRIRFDGKTVVVSGAEQRLGRGIGETLLNWVHACSAAIEPPAELAENRGGRSRHRGARPDRLRRIGGPLVAQIEQTTGGGSLPVSVSGGIERGQSAARGRPKVHRENDSQFLRNIHACPLIRWDRLRLDGVRRYRASSEPGNYPAASPSKSGFAAAPLPCRREAVQKPATLRHRNAVSNAADVENSRCKAHWCNSRLGPFPLQFRE
jgi:hypothetical protein